MKRRTRCCDYDKLFALCDGVRTMQEIATVLGCKLKSIESIILRKDWPRRKQGRRPCSTKQTVQVSTTAAHTLL